MTRPNLLRIAQVCAAALAAAVVSVALARATRAGIASTAVLLTIVGAAGAVASAAWHGTAAAVRMREETLLTRRHRRAARPAGEMERRPAAADRDAPADAPHGLTLAEAAELRAELADRLAPHLAPADARWPDPYAEADPAPTGVEWRPARHGDYEDLYAHPQARPS